jgi:SAM-dependent methyltransferase
VRIVLFMGLVLDSRSIGLYETWLQSPVGKAMDVFAGALIPCLLSPHRNDKILDIGCGTGNQLLSLSRLGFDLSGIDPSPEMIELARNRLGPRCELRSGRAEDLPFSDNEFDIALLINTLEFLDDPLAALKEAGRVARRKVFICVLNSLSLYNLGAGIQGAFHDTLAGRLRKYSLWELKSYIKNAYGSVPVVWRCAPDWPQLKYRNNIFNPNMENRFNNPFGSILCISVILNPLFRAESLPLKIAVKRVNNLSPEG